MAARECGQFRKIREDWLRNLKRVAQKASWINFHPRKVLENARKQVKGTHKFCLLFSVILKMLQMNNLENSERREDLAKKSVYLHMDVNYTDLIGHW